MPRLIHVHPEERKRVALLVAYFFLLVASIIAAKAARDTYFLARFDRSILPLMFVAVAVAALPVAYLYSRVTDRFSARAGLIGSHALFIAALFWFQRHLAGWSIPALYVWVDVVALLSVNQFWLTAGQGLDPRQGKRLFPLIIAGGALAAMVSGVALGPFARWAGSENLLTLASGLLLGALAIGLLVEPVESGSARRGGRRQEPKREKSSTVGAYPATIGAVICAATAVAVLVDYQFKIAAANSFADEGEMIRFFGLISAAAGLTGLLTQLFLLSPILLRFGIHGSILALPLFLLVQSGIILALPALWSFAGARLIDQIFRTTLFTAGLEILWLPVPSERRTVLKPRMGALAKGAEGVAGILAYLSVTVARIPVLIPWITTAFLGGWLLLMRRLRRLYDAALAAAIEARRFDFQDLSIDMLDPAVVDTVRKALRSLDEDEQLLALEWIREIPSAPWKEELQSMLARGSQSVRSRVLTIAKDDPEIVPEAQLLDCAAQSGPAAEAAIRALAFRRSPGAVPLLSRRLEEQDASLQTTCAVALLRIGDVPSDSARAVLDGALGSQEEKEVRAALAALTYFPEAASTATLKNLLAHDRSTVRNAALDLLANSPRAELVSAIAQNLESHKTIAAARRALKPLPDEEVLKFLSDTVRNPESPRYLRRGIVETLQDNPAAGTAELLTSLLRPEDPKFFRACVSALVDVNRVSPMDPELVSKVEEQIPSVLRRYYAATVLQHSLPQSDSALLRDHLDIERQAWLAAVIQMMSLRFPRVPIGSILLHLASDSPSHTGYVLEILDGICPNELRELLYPAVERQSVKTLSALAKRKLKGIDEEAREDLESLVFARNEWPSSLGLERRLATRALPDRLEEIPVSPLNRQLLAHAHGADRSLVANLPDHLTMTTEEIGMFTTLEKTLLLKKTSLFQPIGGDPLYHIAQVCEEIFVPAGDSLFKEGEFGDSMYVVVSGKVRIHRAEKEIATIEKGGCLGEMALLDGEPRSANATASSDATLLRIGQQAFMETMSRDMAIMQGILRLLTRRLREAIR